MRKVLLLMVPCLMVTLLSSSAYGQRTNASIRGTISDTSGGVMPGASVTVTNEDTGLTRTTVTNSDGIYAVGQLPVGRYKVDVEMNGFKTASRTGVLLRVADDYSIDFQLETGAISETVTVEASSTPVRVLGGDVSGVVTGEQVRELPLNGRNFLQLATLMPGVSAPDALNVKDKGLLSGSDMSVSGGDVTANIWTVDGANNNDVGSNRTILVYPSLEAIEEFKILRNSYGPEFGGAGGAQINIVTRGGANEYRGSGFYSGRSDALNAKNYFLEQANQPKEELKRNDYGGSFGGPILKDKLFFFGSLEWNIEDRGTARAAAVPTDAERNGDFSNVSGCSPGVPTDPLTGAAFPGNRIPAERISPAGQSYLKLYPSPNVTPSAGSCNNWVTSVTSPVRYNQQHIRTDWNMSNSNRMMVRYTHDSWKNNAPSIFTNLWGDDPFPSVDSNWDQPSQSFVASFNSTLGSSATNSLQFSYAANKIIIDRGGLDAGLNGEILSKFPTIFPLSSKQYGDETGHPVFWGGPGYSTALWNEAPFRNNQDLFIIKDDYTRVFGKHFFKAGVLVSANKKNEDTNGNGSSMNAQFWGAAGVNGWGATTGNVLADFLLKDMTWGFSESSVSRSAPQRWRDFEGYAADSWQVVPRVTLDYGVRYSLFYNPYTTDDKITSFVPSLFNPALGNASCNGLVEPPDKNWCAEANAQGGSKGPNRSLMTQDKNNIAPRIGIAWDIFGTGKTALRGGVGQFFQRERLSPVLNIATNPPFVTTLTGIRKLDTTVEPCEGCFGNSLGAPASGREVDMRTPNTWQWNVMFQHEIFHNSTVEVGYVGSHGYDLLRDSNVNQVYSGDTNGNGVDDRLEYVTTTPANAALRRYGVFGDAQIGVWAHDGESTYHSLQTQFISRFGRRGSQVQSSYTLARSRANLALTDSGSLAANTAALDLASPDLDWGRPETGRTHIFNISLVWMLPALEGKSGAMRHILGDWELTAITGAATGQPFTAYVASLPGLNGGPSGTGYTDNQRPNRTSEACTGSGPDEQIINPGAYTLNGFQLGTNGTARRGDCTGPGYFQTDLGFYKTFSLGGRARFQFRWDIFNIFNNTNFLFANMEQIMRPSAVTLSADGTRIENATIPANFGQATRTRDPRQMQIGFKILW